MRGLPVIAVIALAATLGGCASSTTTGVCMGASNRQFAQELAWPSFGNSPAKRKRDYMPSQMSALPAAKDDAPEPRATSTEWWMRENARLRKAIVICQGCLPAAIASVALPKPVLFDPQLPAISGASISRVEDSIPGAGPDHF